MTTTATYTKLRDGSWGLRVQGKAFDGQDVLVTTRAGRTVEESVGKVLWSDGKISLCKTFASQMPRRGKASAGRCRRCGSEMEACEHGLICQDCIG